MLIADHDKVKDLFKQFDEIKDVTDAKGWGERQRIAAEVCRELTIHTTIEEELFFSALRVALEEGRIRSSSGEAC